MMTLQRRRTYAAKRATKAVDRMILAESIEDKQRAARWADAWARLSDYRAKG